METVKSVKLLLMGERNFPVAEITISENWVGDFSDLVKMVQQEQPDFTPADVARNVWKTGMKSVTRIVRAGTVLGRDTVRESVNKTTAQVSE